MKPAKNIEKLIKNIDIDTNAKMDEAVLGDVLKALEKSKKEKSIKPAPNIWRTIIKSRITKLATVAAIMIVVALSITFLDKSVAPAYAIEQTIEANRAVQYLHFKYFYKSHDNVGKEFWLEFDESGQLKNARINFSKWVGAGQVIVWGENETRVLDREQNTLTFFRDEIYTAKIFKAARQYDPKRAVESLHARQVKGEVKIEIDMPSNEVDPIVVTGTYLSNTYVLEGSMPQMREVFFIDQTTKLVTAIEVYKLKDGEYEYLGVYEYEDYDQPFNTEIFSLEDEVPVGIMRIHEYSGDNIGLAQGDLRDKEIAIKLVREFFDALIAKDYAKAGQLFGGMSAADVEDKFGTLNIVRIVSIDEPIHHQKPSSLHVPCTVEIEKDGEIVEWQPQGPFVRKVYQRPHHWRIIGGID